MASPTELYDYNMGKIVTNRDQVGGNRRLTDGVIRATLKVQPKYNMPECPCTGHGFGPKTIRNENSKLCSHKREI